MQAPSLRRGYTFPPAESPLSKNAVSTLCACNAVRMFLRDDTYDDIHFRILP